MRGQGWQRIPPTASSWVQLKGLMGGLIGLHASHTASASAWPIRTRYLVGMRDSVIRPWVSRLAWASAALVALGSVVALVAAGGLTESTPLLDRALVLVAVASAVLVVIVPLRSRMLRRQAVEIARQEAILRAVSFAAERFLKTTSWKRDLPEVLARLGRAADASRVHVYENERGPGDELLMSQVAEWAAPGVISYLDDPANQHYPYSGTGFESWEV